MKKCVILYAPHKTAYENYEYDSYSKISGNASSNTHNTLLVNPIEFADSLIDNYKMCVNGNKLYMIVGGKEYSFTKSNTKKPVKVSLNITTNQINVFSGETFEIDVSVKPFWNYHSLTAKSSNPSVADALGQNITSVDGKIKMGFVAWREGNTTITIKDEKTGATTSFNVIASKKIVNVTSVSLNKSSVQLDIGKTDTLIATINPNNASNKNVTWTSSNTNVATVSSSGKITAKGVGTATISVKTTDGGYTAKCEVTVKEPKLTVKASIGVGIYASQSSNVRGVFCEVKPIGGSGSYVAYSIKLYYNGTLIAEKAANEVIVTPVKNGTYTAEVYVKDSSGNEATATKTTTISY